MSMMAAAISAAVFPLNFRHRLGVTKMPRARVWSDEVEANIDLIMAMPDSADFSMGMWGQVFNKDWRLIE